MIRAIASAILGYVVMAIGVVAGIAAVWYLMGSRFAFKGETTTASTAWCVVMLVLGFLAAMIGGLTAAKLGGEVGHRSVRILVVLVLVLGTGQFVAQLNPDPKPLPLGKTVHDLTFMEAGRYAISPDWYNAAIVLVGALGVTIGGRRPTTPGQAL
jgi:hypothetical protein